MTIVCPVCGADRGHVHHCKRGCGWLRCLACKATFDPARTTWWFAAS